MPGLLDTNEWYNPLNYDVLSRLAAFNQENSSQFHSLFNEFGLVGMH
jgi:hypothetical protein